LRREKNEPRGIWCEKKRIGDVRVPLRAGRIARRREKEKERKKRAKVRRGRFYRERISTERSQPAELLRYCHHSNYLMTHRKGYKKNRDWGSRRGLTELGVIQEVRWGLKEKLSEGERGRWRAEIN